MEKDEIREMTRKNSNLVEDLLETIALLPWWVGVALAVVSYLVLHRMAVPPVIAGPIAPHQVSDLVVRSIGTGFASVGQYLLPFLCLVGAGISALKRRKRESLATTVANARSVDVLDAMSWREFEQLVGEAFRLEGYHVTENGGAGPDEGVDLVLKKDGEQFLVQCKQWKALKVGVEVVRELYGVMAAKGAVGGFVVTSGSFTDQASAFASGRNVNLLDGQELTRMIQQARKSIGASKSSMVSASAASDPTPTTSCPACGAVMVKRTAKKGANAGAQFWGCSGYPACRGTRSIG